MPKTWTKLRNNPELFTSYFVREKVLKSLRSFFAKSHYHEVEVPLLTPSLIPESYLEIFETQLLDANRKPQKAYLTPSPELFLKKLLVSGIGNCFTLTKSFRNTETFSNLHNPEFTMLEWYRVEADYLDLMDETEALFLHIAKELGKSETISYQGKKVMLAAPWERLTMVEAWKKHAHINLLDYMELPPMRKLAQKKGYVVELHHTWEQLFNQIYLNEVESKLGQGRPTFIYEFPSAMAALAKKKASDPRFAERFELFIEGLELCDGYSELSDWKEQEARFIAETEERKRLGKIDHPYDVDFINALKVGLPRCSGNAVGIDRLIMLFADVAKISDVLFFPGEEMWD